MSAGEAKNNNDFPEGRLARLQKFPFGVNKERSEGENFYTGDSNW